MGSVVSVTSGSVVTGTPQATVTVPSGLTSGDVVVVFELTNAAGGWHTSLSGLGASWSVLPGSHTFGTRAWIGTGATSDGTITGSGSPDKLTDGIALVAYVVRDVTSDALVDYAGPATSAISSLSATSGDVALGAGYSETAAGALWAASPSGWTTQSAIALFGSTRFGRTTHKVADSTGTHSVEAQRFGGNATSTLVVLPSTPGPPEFAAPSPIAGEIEPVGNPVWLAEFEAPSPIGGEITPFYPEPPPSFAAPSPIRGAIEPFGAPSIPYPTTTVYFTAPSPIGGRMVPSLRPAAPPATLNDHPVIVQYHPVPLGPMQQRVTPFVDYQPIEGVAGRFRVFVDGQDVTFLRDVPTLVEDYSSSDPMGDDAARFSCRQIDEWDELGAGDLSTFDMESDPPVDILFEDAEGNLTHLWDGHIASEDDYATSSDKGRTFVCEGTLKAAAHQPWTPPTYMEPTDPGIVVARAMNSVISRRYAAIPEVVTGLPPIVFRGSQNQSHLDYAVEVLSHMWTEDGRQWSFIKVGPRQYRLGLKAPMDDYDAAIVKGAEGVDVRLRRDQSQRVDGYFGQGIAPNGGQWGNFFFPGLDLFVPPPYPFPSPAQYMNEGTIDADTISGDGVTLVQRRLNELGHPVAVDGVFKTADDLAVRKVQRSMGLLVDGSVGPQTWTGLFTPGVSEVDLGRIRLPLVSKPWVWPTLHAANGAVIGGNPARDPKPVPKLPNVNFGSDITKAEAAALAGRMLAANGDAVYTGSIDLLTDLVAPDGVTPISRFLLREGMRIKVLGHPGEPIVRVGDASKDDLSVRLMVDEKARDAMTLDAIAERDRDARSAVTPKRPGSPQKISAILRDHVTQFEDESKAGRIPSYPVNGHVGLWSVFPIFVSQTGRISKFVMNARPKTTFVVALFGKPIQPQVLASMVPDPIADGGGWRTHHDTLVLDHALCAIYGQPGALGGYAPRVQSDGGPITGDLFDDSGLEFESEVGGYLWLAVFSAASTVVSGRAFPAVPS